MKKGMKDPRKEGKGKERKDNRKKETKGRNEESKECMKELRAKETNNGENLKKE